MSTYFPEELFCLVFIFLYLCNFISLFVNGFSKGGWGREAKPSPGICVSYLRCLFHHCNRVRTKSCTNSNLTIFLSPAKHKLDCKMSVSKKKLSPVQYKGRCLELSVSFVRLHFTRKI